MRTEPKHATVNSVQGGIANPVRKFDPDTSFVTVVTHDGLVNPRLIYWLDHVGIDRSNVNFYRGTGYDMAVDYNAAVEYALSTQYDTLMFIDRDIMPQPDTVDPFFELPYDITGAKYELGPNNRWNDDTFHSGFWCASRSVIMDVGVPLFQWQVNGAGSVITGCMCQRIARKARALGYTTGHAGVVGHVPRQPHPSSLRIML